MARDRFRIARTLEKWKWRLLGRGASENKLERPAQFPLNWPEVRKRPLGSDGSGK